MKIIQRIFIGLFFSFIFWNAVQACSPERYAQSRIFRLLKPGLWVDEGWGFPVSVPGVSRWNSDCKPSLTADGKYLYFIAAAQNGPPYDTVHVGGRDFNVYVARWNGVAWDSVTNLGTNVNQASYACISADNRTLYVTKGSKIHVSPRTPTGWTKVKMLPYLVNDPDPKVTDRTPFITPDGRELYFASERAGGYGSFDLYVVRWNGSAWDSLTNLGPRINTIACETHPARTWDGKKMYYSDFGGRSQQDKFGDADLYVSSRDASGWGPGQLVGPPVNTDLPCCSAFPTKDGKLYIGSEVSEGGMGEEDIWVVREKNFEITRETVTLPGAMGWRNTGELQNAWYVYCLLEARDGSIYAGTAPSGDVFKTTNGGITWEKTGKLQDASRVYSLIEMQNRSLFAGTYPNGDVFKSTNGGATWVNTADLLGAKIVHAMIELPNGKILAGTSPDSSDAGRLFSTSNGGSTWKLSYTPLPPLFKCKAGFRSFFYTDGVLFAGLRAGGDDILFSTNDGDTWKVVNLPFPDDQITLTEFDFFYKTSDGAIWTGGWAHGPQGVVARSTDKGVTWTAASEIRSASGIEMARIFSMVELKDGTLLAGGHPGPDSIAVQTKDKGATWTAFGTLPKANELLCFLKTKDGSVYAGTTPNGDVFKLAGPTDVSAKTVTPVEFDLSQNYPNPFNMDTFIHFRLTARADVDLAVFDVLGNRVRLLAEGEKSAGDSFFIWNGCDDRGRELASGVYFYRLTVREADGTVHDAQYKMLMIK